MTLIQDTSFTREVIVLALVALFVYNAVAIWSWCRTAWVCRKLPNGSGNFVYGGLFKMLSFNRLREFQKMNEAVVRGSGVFYFQVLWRQVCQPNAFNTLPRAAMLLMYSCLGAPMLETTSQRHERLQTVVVTEPRLMAQLLQDKSLHKPVEPDYAHFNKVVPAFLSGLHSLEWSSLRRMLLFDLAAGADDGPRQDWRPSGI